MLTQTTEMKMKRSINTISKINGHIYIAYSGGKDSTALALLVMDAIKSGAKIKRITLVHNDTMSEIDLMEYWARYFMRTYTKEMGELGVEVDTMIVRPKPFDTFYWRVFMRGYPAPTFSFRWCVASLKIRPARDVLPSGSILLVGLRDEESSERAKSMKKRFVACSISQGDCMADKYLSENNVVKIAPMRDWTEEEVWEYLKTKGMEQLFQLYFNDKVRYGCWHCTLVKTQWGNRINKQHAYFDALRIIYRTISDIPELRTKKDKGYSKLGPLTMEARAFFLKAMLKTEKLAGIRLYGLDEIIVEDYSLREILTTLEAEVADKIIREDVFSTNRFTTVEDLRTKTINEKFLEMIDEKTKSHSDRFFEKDDLIREIIW